MSEALSRLCRGVLDASWAEGERQGVPFGYTRPSPTRYPWQWYWDSCFAAIVWRRFEAGRSRSELESLLRAQREDGFIGHVIFWDAPISLRRRTYYNVDRRSSPMTGTIQPPLLAWAWRIAVGDPVSEPRIGMHHEWLRANRDLEGDGLLWLIQPDESGLDSSPKFDPIWGWRSHARWGFPVLVAGSRRHGWDARRIRDAGRPVVCEVVTNVLWGLSRLACGEESITPALVERLWDERSGLFLDEAVVGRRRGGGARPAGAPGPGKSADRLRPEVDTWAAMAPLALPDLPEEIGRRMIEERLLDTEHYWHRYPPSSVSAREPAFEPNRGPGWKLRYWRGPTWINAAWMLWMGMVRLGYADEATEMARRLGSLVEREGLREYYDPLTGEGLGARDFAWSSLILELTDPDHTAASHSYL